MAIITTDEVKVFLQITGTAKDDLIDALIPEVQGDIVAYCNNDFLNDAGAEAWPAGIKLPAAMMVGYNMAEMAGGSSIGLQSESQGEYSYTRESSSGSSGSGAGEYPATILAKLNKWKLSRVHFGSKMQSNQDRRGMTPAQLANGEYVEGIEGEVLNED